MTASSARVGVGAGEPDRALAFAAKSIAAGVVPIQRGRIFATRVPVLANVPRVVERMRPFLGDFALAVVSRITRERLRKIFADESFDRPPCLVNARQAHSQPATVEPVVLVLDAATRRSDLSSALAAAKRTILFISVSENNNTVDTTARCARWWQW